MAVFGVLLMVIVVEMVVLFSQSNRQRQSKPVSYTAPSPSPKPKENPLPFSSPDKNGVQVYVNPTDPISKDYITWVDGDFYYYRPKNFTQSTRPYLVRGIVKKVKDNEFEVEAKTADNSLYVVKIKLMPEVTVKKDNKKVSITDIKVGDLAQFWPLNKTQKEGEYYLVHQVTVF
ncbi:MAG: hypothetical protein N2559_06960 [Anaerolineae bacterium]|nr:hypothetical protein [Anaerolineae bacterium]